MPTPSLTKNAIQTIQIPLNGIWIVLGGTKAKDIWMVSEWFFEWYFGFFVPFSGIEWYF